jgi:hypothetical protein
MSKTISIACTLAAAATGLLLALAGPALAGNDGAGRATKPAAANAGSSGRAAESARSEASLGAWRGQTHAQWTQAWWRWWMSIPAIVSPAEDPTGANCGINQDGPVWFLAGPLGSNYERTCTIPYGKAILSPVVDFINDYPCPDPTFTPGPGQTLEDFLTVTVAPYLDRLTLVDARLNGTPLKTRRVTTKVFGFTGAANLSKFDGCVTGSPQLGISDGYFFVIEPLPRGDHVLQINSNSPDFGATSGTFNLKIR